MLRKVLAVSAIALLVLAVVVGYLISQPKIPPEYLGPFERVLSRHEDRILVISYPPVTEPPCGDLYIQDIRSGRTVQNLGLCVIHAAFTPDGDLIFIDTDFSLKRLADEQIQEIFPPASVTSPLLVHPSGRFLAYGKPADYSPMYEAFDTYGIAVYDFQTKQEKVLLMQRGQTEFRLYGWRGEELIIQLPPSMRIQINPRLYAGSPPPHTIWHLLALDGSIRPFPGLERLPALLSGPSPLSSLDGRFVAYEGGGGIVLVSVEEGTFTIIEGARQPRVTPEGIVAGVGGREVLITPASD